MTDRVNRYFRLPASNELVRHFREDIGLQGEYLAIFDDLRGCLADTRCHASNVGLPLRIYNEQSAILGQHCIYELIRLAEIGLKAEQK